MHEQPKVGLGVLIFNHKNQILLGKRKNAHGEASWAPPGGHLEFGETFEKCAAREVLEETGVVIENSSFLGVTNDFMENDQKHYVSVFMKTTIPDGQTVQNTEPHKNESWEWFDWDALPDNLFHSIKQLKSGRAYGKIDC